MQLRAPFIGCLAATIVLLLASCGGGDSGGEAPTATKPAACERTPEQTEGPYYKRGPPERKSLLGPGVTGTRLVITGRVRFTDCRPAPRARVDFWQANGDGAYDNQGFRLRGYQLTDKGGRYRVETVVPGLYEGRTRHVHVKVTPRGAGTLTTQLYFPNEPRNSSDAIFDPATVLRLRRDARPWQGTYDFIVER